MTMVNFSKNCPVCTKNFTDLVSFMTHLRDEHGNLSPSQLRDIGKQKKPISQIRINMRDLKCNRSPISGN